MSKTILALLSVFLFGNATAQNKPQKERSGDGFGFYVEAGVNNFINNLINNSYGSGSTLVFTGGFRFADPDNKSLLPYFEVSTARLKKRGETIGAGLREDTTLKLTAYGGGVNIVLHRFGKSLIVSRIGMFYGNLSGTFLVDGRDGFGANLGLGLETHISKSLRSFVQFSYQHLKTTQAGFNDFTTQRFSIGFIL